MHPSPFISVVLGATLVLSGCEKLSKPGGFQSRGRVLVSKPGTEPADTDEDRVTAQIELIRSGEIGRRAHERIQAKLPGRVPITVDIKVLRTSDSNVLTIMGTGSDADYVQAYVDAVMDEYLLFLDEMRDSAASSTTNLIAKEVLRLEREIVEKEKAVEEFRKKSDEALLESQNRTYQAAITELRLRIADLEVARKAGDADKKVMDENIAERKKEIVAYEEKFAALGGEMRTLQKLEREVEKLRVPYATLQDTLKEMDFNPLEEVTAVSIVERATVAVPGG